MMKKLTHKQKLAMAWRATPAAHRAYVAGQKSVLAFRRSKLHLLPLTALSQQEIHLRIHMALRADAREHLVKRGYRSLLTVDGQPWAVAFDGGRHPAVVHLQDVARGITTPDQGDRLDGAEFARRFQAAQAVAAKLNALSALKATSPDKEKTHG